jgi:hypothetical protein
MEIIRQLEVLGYKVFLQGNRLCYEFIGKGKPDPTTATDLLQKLKAQKKEIVNYLQFTQNNSAVKINSEVLQEDVWLLSSDKMRNRIDNDLVVYFPEEIVHLSKLKAGSEHIRKVHAVKKVFPGSKIVWN